MNTTGVMGKVIFWDIWRRLFDWTKLIIRYLCDKPKARWRKGQGRLSKKNAGGEGIKVARSI